jgi:deoxyribose-phosphate aldolase
MINVESIAREIFNIKEIMPSRSGGDHCISLHSEIDRSSFSDQWPVDNRNLAPLIDHTVLRPDATETDILEICREAEEYGFCSVCVNPVFVRLVKGNTQKSLVCSVIGFPLGASTASIKCAETRNAISEGASEIDMVINLGDLKAGYYDRVFNEIKQIARICHESGVMLKVIIETCLLTEKEKVIACLISKKGGADFVKTSTGFNKGGATVEDVSLMRRVVGFKMGVKASGGIRDRQTALQMLKAGANRIGASSGIAIVKG